jgi:putative transcriptional regulator
MRYRRSGVSRLSEPAVIFDGGPVSNREVDGYIAVALLRPNVAAPVRFRQIRDRLGTISLAADPEQVGPALSELRLYSGYLGWGPKQLEADLDEGRLVRSQQSAAQAIRSARPAGASIPP